VGDGLDVGLGDRADDGPQVAGADVDPAGEQRGKIRGRCHGVDADDAAHPRVVGEPDGEMSTDIPADAGHQHVHLRLPVTAGGGGATAPPTMDRAPALLAETATLDAGLAQQLAVLLLGHSLAALLDHRAHTAVSSNECCGPAARNGSRGPSFCLV
jgi:hypothetical protein